ncbi:Protein N-terminal glutamine amidohydrolase [Abortiporus biennis]
MESANNNPLLTLHPPPIPQNAVYTSCYCEENIYLLAKTFQEQSERDPQAFPWNVYVVFISNSNKTVALWNQKHREDVVVWDYHVILVLRSSLSSTTVSKNDESEQLDVEPSSWVFDFDSQLSAPCPGVDYFLGTFPYVVDSTFGLSKSYISSFRVVPARTYLDQFASDRSHMIRRLEDGTGTYFSSPPPTYPPLCGVKARAAGVTHNLMSAFVCMGPEQPQLVSRAEHVLTESQGVVDMVEQSGEDKHRGYGRVLSLDEFSGWLTHSSAS